MEQLEWFLTITNKCSVKIDEKYYFNIDIQYNEQKIDTNLRLNNENESFH